MITVGKINEAIEELKYIAKYNGKKLSEESLKKLEMFKCSNEKEIEIVNLPVHHVWAFLPVKNPHKIWALDFPKRYQTLK